MPYLFLVPEIFSQSHYAMKKTVLEIAARFLQSIYGNVMDLNNGEQKSLPSYMQH